VIAIEVIALVYKSKAYCEFITDQLVEYAVAKDAIVTSRIVANDPEVEGILDYPRSKGLAVSVYNDEKPDDYYLNRVYRCWNWAVKSSMFESVCLVNSDMAFSRDWLTNLLKGYVGETVPTSRLVESGKMRSGRYGISKNFGKSPETFRKREWEEWASQNMNTLAKPGGLFMPVVFDQQKFLLTGGFPEGNIYADGVGTCNGDVLVSGDAYYYKLLETTIGLKHVTRFDSLVYHIQEGEMDE